MTRLTAAVPARPESGLGALNAGQVITPFNEPAGPGMLVEVASGVLWARLPLPYEPGHVNTYLIRDDDGWCVVDAGLLDDATRETWGRIVASLPSPRRISRVLVTHWHSDHLGAAGWLCETFGASLLMSESEYLKGLSMELMPQGEAQAVERRFFLAHGLDAASTERWVTDGHRYLRMAAPLPRIYKRLVDGNDLVIGDRRFLIETAAGHSPEEVMLRSSSNDIFLCADQLGPRIAPNLAVQSSDPEGDPLSLYLRSLDRMEGWNPGDALLLPGHEVPFRGFRRRVPELRAYYKRRCDIVEEACREGQMTARELVSRLYRRPPSPVWIGFIVSEAVAYANHLVEHGRLRRTERDGLIRFVTVDAD